MSRSNSPPSSSRRREHFAEYWQDPTCVSSEEVVLLPQPTATHANRKKKRSRGNRALQKLRAKLRKQGLSEEAIASIVVSQSQETRGEPPTTTTTSQTSTYSSAHQVTATE